MESVTGLPQETASNYFEPGNQQALTLRQLEVLKLMSEGLSSKQIANALGVALKTAGSHRTQILKRLGVPNTVLAMRWAIRAGIIHP
jgi:DNA-binding CsgD family transcriptional regulator